MKKAIIFSLLALAFALPLPAAAIIASPTPAIDYQLPYPGILPNSPFYKIKIIRDKVSGFFISNPLKKAEYAISMADVRMSAALVLTEQKNNPALAKTTLSKAQNYLEEAIANIKTAKAQGIDTQDLVKRLNQAKHKHQEIIIEIEKKINKNEVKKH